MKAKCTAEFDGWHKNSLSLKIFDKELYISKHWAALPIIVYSVGIMRMAGGCCRILANQVTPLSAQ